MRLGRLLLQTCGEKEPHPEAVAEMLRHISGGFQGGRASAKRRVGGDGVSSSCLTRLDLTVEPDFGMAAIHLQVHVKGE